jgi:NAD-dependent deacetylase
VADLKPDVIIFGEQLPETAWNAAQKAVRKCDLIIVAGSSLEVLPVAGLPMVALDRGAHLIIINNTPTYLNIRADVAILDDLADVLPLMVEQLLYAESKTEHSTATGD